MPEGVPAALSAAADLDLSAYRERHVQERIQRALEREHMSSVAGLARLLRADADARRRFRRSVAVSVSGVFRDPAQFELLERELLPPLAAAGGRIRVWSAGCADGSELYSVALLLVRLEALDRSFLLGSDVLEDNLEAARRGVYAGVAAPESIRQRLRWERRDLVRAGPAPGKWQLVLCRNVAIYLAPAARHALYRGLADALARGGVLLLGRSERLTDPRGLGLELTAPHAYRRLA